ncbi:MAG: TIGR01440 family protein [Lachnospiraceae bacterium]|nr:TIGR01440 family protein [Candidatus Merdinaster equi]
MIKQEAYDLVKEFIDKANMKAGQLLVIGCSTSEVHGSMIGKDSKPEIADELFCGAYEAAKESGIYIAAQCCEHLNRALIIPEEVAIKRGYEIVNVVPQPKAGGSFATMAYKYMESPVAVEHIKAEGGIDIGDTLIGMHLRDVAVPVRLSVDKLGQAHVVCARTRPKFIGGERAIYKS